MITTETEYRTTQQALWRLEAIDLPAEQERWLAEGASEADLDELLAQTRSQAAELRDRLTLYERIRAGDLSMFHRLTDVGDALIAARIAKGWTQRELAARLGVHGSQVSRDERAAYYGVTAERLQTVLNVLGVQVEAAFILDKATRH